MHFWNSDEKLTSRAELSLRKPHIGKNRQVEAIYGAIKCIYGYFEFIQMFVQNNWKIFCWFLVIRVGINIFMETNHEELSFCNVDFNSCAEGFIGEFDII